VDTVIVPLSHTSASRSPVALVLLHTLLSDAGEEVLPLLSLLSPPHPATIRAAEASKDKTMGLFRMDPPGQAAHFAVDEG
jgi:hypothetical protein